MKKKIITGFLLVLLLLFDSCQGLTDFIPPDFEEKLCVNAVINNGRDQNKIIVEKTYQNEYPSEVKASLEDLSVIISSESGVVFEYFNPKSENRIDTIRLPADMEFIPDQKYTLIISEKKSESITSEIVMPHSPSNPEISIEGMVQTFLPPLQECHNPVTSIVLSVNFRSDEDQFYYLDIEGYMNPYYNDTLRYLIDYDIIESNTSYFRAFIHGFMSFGFRICRSDFLIPAHIYQPCFFDSKTIPGNACNFKIKIDINTLYDFTRQIRVTLNSIPKDLYTYEKSYHTYLETLFDPFSEPVYIRGNIKGGYGIFAICGGSQTSLILPTD